MADMTVVWLLIAVVLLIVLGQWLMMRRAKLAIGPVPDDLNTHCPKARVFYFFAPNCNNCRLMQPQIEELRGRFGQFICSINVHEHPELAQAARVVGTPTTLFARDGEIKSAYLGNLSTKAWVAGMTEAGLTDDLSSPPENQSRQE
ncbi:MAG TPA: thioredoxin [Halothiobacillaceae bacterium]|nr:thioredoxin [Halothiobacillaceae bacterium]